MLFLKLFCPKQAVYRPSCEQNISNFKLSSYLPSYLWDVSKQQLCAATKSHTDWKLTLDVLGDFIVVTRPSLGIKELISRVPWQKRQM